MILILRKKQTNINLIYLALQLNNYELDEDEEQYDEEEYDKEDEVINNLKTVRRNIVILYYYFFLLNSF